MIKFPPPPGPVKKVPYPEVEHGVLENGLQILTVEDRHMPRVVVRMAVRAGKVDDPDHNRSLLPFAFELVKEGAGDRTGQEIADLMDRKAIQFDTEVQLEHTILYLSVLEDQIETGIEMLSEMVQAPTFPADELERLKIRWRSELIAQRSIPRYLAGERVYEMLYRGHPYVRAHPRLNDLATARLGQVKEIFFRRVVPSRSLILMAGSISHSEALELAQRHFGGWEDRSAPEVDFPSSAFEDRRRIGLVHRPHSKQVRLVLARHSFAKGHRDEFPYRVADQVLGGGGSARLFLNIRERLGYTYGIYSRNDSFRRSGLAMISADVNGDRVVEALNEISKELDHMRQSPPRQEEMRLAKASLIGKFLFQMETPGSRGMLELIRHLYDLPRDYYRNYIPVVQSVDADQVRELARRYLDPDRFLITVVGDRTRLEKDLAPFGPLSVFDADGQALE